MMKNKVRETTMWLLNSAEDGCITWEHIARAAMGYMSEAEVADMCRANDFPMPDDEDDEYEDEMSPSNPNNCNTCDHKKHPDGGWCYMFRDEPEEVCYIHTERLR